ncbi:hypothetical protein [Massilia antarctica]|uniref:hypothetical protein n=1 Tax=Massilia antarctica TaxID=2765360 RepID=UPI00226D5238|nr:hypothetical protein [Massilia sp. H27-R4]MCY0910913.1 hypothetical protein [Massilia sp. H27-R4]
MKLRWKKEPKATGLSAIGAGPRGSSLHDGEKCYAMVWAQRRNYQVTGWYWVAGWDSNVPHLNTHSEPVATEEEAKAAAMAYVKEHLKVQPENGGEG